MDADRRVERLEEMFAQLIRFGEVVSLDPGAATVRVRLADADGLVSYNLPVLNHKTHKDKAYWMPDVGEHVACLFLGNGVERGVVLGAVYSKGDATPVQDPDKRHILFEDGTWLEYDRREHKLSGLVKGDVVLEVEQSVALTVGKNLVADVGENLTATVGQGATVKAGQAVTVQAPLINLRGRISSTDATGGKGAVHEISDRTHDGSYRLTGPMTVDGNVELSGPVTISGDLAVSGVIRGVVEGGA